MVSIHFTKCFSVPVLLYKLMVFHTQLLKIFRLLICTIQTEKYWVGHVTLMGNMKSVY